MAVKTRPRPKATDPMGKKRSDDSGATNPESGGEGPGRPSIGKQVNVRIPPDLMADLEVIAKDSGLDISAVIRMILTQNRGGYIRQIRERRQQQGDE